MAESVLDALTVLELPMTDRERLGLPSGPLELRRAWPRSPHHLGLEYVAGDGSTIAGQWFSDIRQLQRVAHATAWSSPATTAAVVIVEGARVLLQADGADRRLPGLAPLVARPGARLLVHRPERRAIVRLETPDGPSYAKVVPPERTGALAAAGYAVRNLARGAFTTPDLLEVDADAGVIVWSALPGVSLYELLSSERLVPAARAAGCALRALHTSPPLADATAHDDDAEIGVLQGWLERLEAFVPHPGSPFRATASGVFEALAAASSPPVLLHRDFYDKQVFVDGGGRVGLLDFDTLAMGEAALDVANVLVHFELRALQGHCPPGRAKAAVTALLEGCQPSPHVRRRIGAYADATRLRLACVYAFRPCEGPLVPMLLAQVGQSVVGAVEIG